MKKSIFLLLLLVLGACNREPIEEVVSKEPIIKPPSEVVQGSITGIIVDQLDQPVSAVAITAGLNDTETKTDGTFSLADIELFEDGTLVTASKQGYFSGSRKFYAEDGHTNFIKIQLVPKDLVESISSNNGGSVSFGSAEIEFPTGSYINDQNEPFSGELHIYGKWFDPTKKSTFFEMPGDMTGFNSSGELTALSSFGLLRLEINNSDNEVLSLPEGEWATITMKVPPTLLAYAQQTIQLSYFSEKDGFWVEEGTAELNGDSYVGQVRRSGYWNANISFPVVEVSGSITIDGNSANNSEIKISSIPNGYIAYTTTTAEAFFKSRLPKNTALDFVIINTCDNSEEIITKGPFTETAFNLEVNYELEVLSAQLDGSISSCETNSNNFVIVDIGATKSLHRPDSNGQFSFPVEIKDCRTKNVTLYGLDIENGFISDANELEVSKYILVQDLQACSEIPTGFQIEYDGMDWSQELKSQVSHKWTVHYIAGSQPKYIFETRMMNDVTGEDYMTGGFVFSEGAHSAEFLLEFPHRDIRDSLGTLDVFEFSAASSEFSDAMLGTFTMNLVYYN